MASHSSRQQNTRDLQHLVPTFKSDMKAIEKLSRMNPEEWEPIAYDVLDWCADSNWPIARHVADLFVEYPQNAVQAIKRVFCGNDIELLYNVFVSIIEQLPREWQVKWLDDLKTFDESRTPADEDAYEMNDDVRKLIHDLEVYQRRTLNGNGPATARRGGTLDFYRSSLYRY